MGIYSAIYNEEYNIYGKIADKIRSRYYNLRPGLRNAHSYMIKNFYSFATYEDYIHTNISLHERSMNILGKKFLLKIEMKNLIEFPVAGFDAAQRKVVRKMINSNDEEMVDMGGRILSKFRNKRIRKYGKKTELG